MAKHVCIIGGGLGGLSAAMILAYNGYKVTLFEKNSTLGGKLQELKTPEGYRFDVGPTLITLPFVFENLFKKVERNLEDYLSLKPLEISCKYNFSDSVVFNAFTEQNAFVESLCNTFSDSEKSWHHYYRYIERIYKATHQSFIFNPLSASTLLRQNPLNFFKIDPFSTVHRANMRFFKDSRVVQFLDRFPTYVGSSPYLAPATLNVIPYVELAFGSYTIAGGLYRLVEAYTNVCLELGVEFYLNQEVEQILVKNNKVKGLLLNNDKNFPCDAIVSNDDAIHTYQTLLNRPQKNYVSQKTIPRWEASCSGFIMCLGIKKTYQNLVHHNIFFSRDYQQEFHELFAEKTPATEPTIYISISSKSFPGDAPEGSENWFVLVNAPFVTSKFDWNTQKQAYRDLIIRELKHRGFADIEDHIDYEYIATPLNIQDWYNANCGSIYGINSNSKSSAFLRPKNRSPYVKGLYLASGSAHPGGGTPMVTLSGQFAAQLLMMDFKN